MLLARCLLCLAGLLVTTRLAGDETENAARLTDDVVVRFATVDQGRAAIARRDAFIESLSTFDLQSRLKSARGDLKADDLLTLYRDNVTPWPAEEQAHVAAALALVAGKLKGAKVPWPKEILFIRTTGLEESGAAYCRGPAVVLPAGLVKRPGAGLQRLVAHELFHVLSSHAPELRTDLYALIGFKTCAPIAVPKSLRERTISNPDAPQMDCVIALESAGRKVHAAPILLATPDKFDPDAKKSMFAYLQFRLLVVQEVDGKWTALEKDGAAELLDPRQESDFHKQIGGNTRYIIHPDEILADNFSHWIMGTAQLPNPELIEKLAARFKK